VVIERGAVSVDGADTSSEPLLIHQRSTESAREFAQRVATRLAELERAGGNVRHAAIRLSSARGNAATARRFTLARVVLAGLPHAQTLSFEGDWTSTAAGRLDVEALAETLQAQLGPSVTTIETPLTAPAIRGARALSIVPTAAGLIDARW
jgi:hypothetical protein